MRPDRLYLQDIVEAGAAVRRFVDGVGRERFLNDDLRQSAVLHKLTVMGEAAARLSKEFRSANPEIPWRDVAAFRNFAVHAYFAVNWSIVWATATRDAPALEQQVARLLADLGPAEGPG